MPDITEPRAPSPEAKWFLSEDDWALVYDPTLSSYFMIDRDGMMVPNTWRLASSKSLSASTVTREVALSEGRQSFPRT